MQRRKTGKKEGRKNFFGSFLEKIKNFFIYNPPGKTPRIWELDILRGLVIIMVTLDHCCYFTAAWGIIPYKTEFGLKLMEIAQWYVDCSFRKAIQPFGLFFICFLSGLNSRFAHSNIKRVLKAWIICALYMGGFTLLSYVYPDKLTTHISFNIIAVLTISYTVWWIMDLVKCPTWVRTGIGVILICIGFTAFYKYFIEDETFTVSNDFLSMLVYNNHGFELSETNFEPLLPHLGWFIIGGVFSQFLYKDGKTHCKQEYPPKALYPVLFVGKHSLALFLLGPVIILSFIYVIVWFVGLFL